MGMRTAGSGSCTSMFFEQCNVRSMLKACAQQPVLETELRRHANVTTQEVPGQAGETTVEEKACLKDRIQTSARGAATRCHVRSTHGD